jgi:hypothetical protein
MEGTMYDYNGRKVAPITGTQIVMGKDSIAHIPSQGYISAFIYKPPSTTYQLDSQGMCTKEYIRRIYD